MFSNFLLKYLIFKPLYKLFNTSKLSFLGLGSRPAGANSCKFTLDKKADTSFGMPSGHSQIAWTVSTYIICKLIYNMLNNKYNDKDTIIKVRNYIWFFVSFIFSNACINSRRYLIFNGTISNSVPLNKYIISLLYIVVAI